MKHYAVRKGEAALSLIYNITKASINLSHTLQATFTKYYKTDEGKLYDKIVS